MISQFFIDRPRFACVISTLIIIVGVISITVLPVAHYPDLTPPQVTVTTSYPGADAETVMKTVIEPLENQINGVQDMIYMSSMANNNGTAVITVSFKVGSNANMNTVNVENRVAIAMPLMPAEVKLEGVITQEVSSNVVVFASIQSPDNKYDALYLNNYAYLNIISELQRVHGVGKVSLLGELKYSMRIWLDPNKLASLGLTASDVLNSIEGQNIQVAAGQIGGTPISDEQQLNYSIKMEGRLSTVEEFNDIIIRENSDGSLVAIQDVGRAELGSESYSALAYKNNKPCALLAVYQRPGANAVQVSSAVKDKLQQLSEFYPDGLTCTVNFDITKFVFATIKSVITTLIIAIVLVLLIVFIFLQDWRSTLIPMLAIPVSLIGTFAGLLVLGYSINTVTLFALILAIGIVVDDAIVVIENVRRIMEQEGLDAREATIKSMKQVTNPIIATTFVLMGVFIPSAFIPGITGQLYRQFAVTIAIAVLISAFNALTLTPPLCALLLKTEKAKKLFIFVWFNKFFSIVTRAYNRNVNFLLKRVTIVLVTFIILLLLCGYLFNIVPKGFIPIEDQGYFFVNIQLPEGAALPRTEKIVNKVSNILQKAEGVEDVLTVSGWSMLTGLPAPNTGMACVILKNWSKRKPEYLHVESIIKRVNEKLYSISKADVVAFNVPPIMGLGTAGGFNYELLLNKSSGKTVQDLAEVMRAVVYEANQQPEIGIAYSTFQSKVPQIFIKVNRKKARKLGVHISEIFNTLQTYLGSSYVNEFNKFGKVFQVLVQAEEKYRRKIKTIYGLYVRNNKNEMVPLGTLITIKPVFGPAVLNHYNMFTSVSIHGSAAKGYSSGQAIAAMERVSKNVLPRGFTYSWTGTAYQEILAGNKAAVIFVFAFILVYLFLVALYESLMIAITVILSIPVAIFGALGATWLTGLSNNIYTQIGFVLLLGLACKTAILIVEFAKKEHEDGASIIDAAKHAAGLRFRAVIMTSIAFILGVLPLVFANGAGSGSSHSMGTTVFGGMLVAAVLGTIVIPAFYLIIQKVTERKFGKKTNNKKIE